MTSEFNVLLSSAGRRVALLEILRSTLADLELSGRVIAADASPTSAAYHAADGHATVPRCTDVGFIASILELCQTERIRLIVPTIDTELAIYAAHRDDFEKIGVTVAVSSPAVIAISADKVQTHDWLTKEGFPTVRQALAVDILDDPDGWRFPLVAKPRAGSASVGVVLIEDRDALRTYADRVGFIVQQRASGDEFTIDVLADRAGRCISASARRRLEVRSGETSKGITVASGMLEALGRNICEALPGTYGVINVQVFVDPETGDRAVIEINPRFAGGFPLTWQAGGAYPRWMIEEILGLKHSTPSIREGVVMLRYDAAVYVNAGDLGP